MNYNHLQTYQILIIAVGSLLFLIAKIIDLRREKLRQAEDLEKDMFLNTLKGFSSSEMSERISAAILLRRFLAPQEKRNKKAASYKQEAINIIVSSLRLERYGELQKTLSDSLSYVVSIPEQDLQKVNLQEAIIKPQTPVDGSPVPKINMRKVDFYQADLSYANFTQVDLSEAAFYQTNLFSTVFHDCDFKNANFYGADLLKAQFKGTCQLEGAQFAAAKHVPPEILEHLDTKGVWHDELPEEHFKESNNKRRVFISSLGSLTPKQAETVLSIEKILDFHGIECVRYTKKNYRNSGQINQIRAEMDRCNGVIVLGFKSILVERGWYRPDTNVKKRLSNVEVSTPWNSIEAGMACALGLPVLIISEQNINDGIFDEVINDKSITRCNLNNEETLKEIISWSKTINID